MKRSSLERSSDQHRTIRLMIHAMDGCVPFLTPDILEKHFPPSDDLWIGMAVRDTCVLPIMADPTMPSNEQLEQREQSGDNQQSKVNKKPRGYTFAPVAPDSWLLPYTRVTVPSFNWMDDNARVKEKRGHRPPSGSTSSNEHILVWTPHGRQKLTPELYANASIGLKSTFTLSLYDMREDPATKRVNKANARNKEWFEHLLKQRQDDSGADDSLWSPILLPKDNTSDLIISHETNEDVAGVALIGAWRSDLVATLQGQLKGIPYVAMLSTSCLADILEIIASDVVNVVGTDLPNQWAQQKLAFAVDFRDPSDEKKRIKTAPDAITAGFELNDDGCMDMKDKSFANDPRPLVTGCQCLACARGSFSRAYVHHLICAKELLADVLLFGHNLHHLLEMIRAFNASQDPSALSDSIYRQVQTDANRK
jgi:hypothetical protein